METLPQEVVDQIASNLYRSDLKNLLLLSPKLHMAAEKYSEGFTKCRLQRKDLDEFVEKFRGPRFCWLHELEFDLGPPGNPAGDDGIDSANGRDDDKIYGNGLSDQIHALFNALKTLEDADAPQGTIQLKIISSGRPGTVPPEPTAGCCYVRLERPQKLPVLQSIGSLYIGPPENQQASNCHPKLALRTPLDLSSKLPNLRMIRFDLADEHDCDAETEGARVEEREDFARAVGATTTTTLQTKRAEIIFQGRKAHELLDHDSAMPNLVRAGPGDDLFSSSLRVLCRHLTQLQLTAVIDKSFFWPGDGRGDVWPNMESLEVKFHPATPAGSWYFIGPRGEGRGVQGYPVDGVEYSGEGRAAEGDTIVMGHAPCRPSGWRVQPNPDTLYPFLAAFAKAAAKMPRLKEAMIWSPIWWSPGSHARSRFAYHSAFDMVHNQRPLGWGIGYNAPESEEEPGAPASDDENVRIFEWRTGSWEPDETMKDLFHEIGREEHGEEYDDDWDPGANQEDLFFEGFCFGKTLD